MNRRVALACLGTAGALLYPSSPAAATAVETARGADSTWSPPFTVGAGASSWWIEIYTSADVVGLDVVATDFYLSLAKWTGGAWAASPPRELVHGDPLLLIARRSDGSTAGSYTFGWMTDSSPGTRPGWNASFTVHQCGPLRLEATISAEAVAATVRIGTANWAAMTRNLLTQRWEKTPGVPVGTQYLISADLPSGPRAYDLIRTC